MRRAIENEERFVVDRRGEPQVVIMGIEAFIKTIAPEPKVLRALAGHGLHEVGQWSGQRL
jgi:hypothetical protein